MFEKMQTGRAQPLSEDDERTIGFVRFIDARGFSADQIREAYYRLCGISETGNDDPAIEEIRERMQTMTDKKFSLNRFASLIGVKQEYEDAKLSCFNFINALPVSDNEKEMLHSIVERRRDGELSIVVDGRRAATVAIHIRENLPSETVALEFMDMLKRVTALAEKSGKYEFSFVEE